jgi:hypothetical protein
MEIAIAAIAVVFVVAPLWWPLWKQRGIASGHKKGKRNRSSGSFIAPFDEVFHPAAYSAHLLWEAEQSIPAPAPNSDDTQPDLTSGHIAIRVNKSGEHR